MLYTFLNTDGMAGERCKHEPLRCAKFYKKFVCFRWPGFNL